MKLEITEGFNGRQVWESEGVESCEEAGRLIREWCSSRTPAMPVESDYAWGCTMLEDGDTEILDFGSHTYFARLTGLRLGGLMKTATDADAAPKQAGPDAAPPQELGRDIEHPSRYNQGGIEVWDIQSAFFGADSHIDHLAMGAIEYLLRFRRKNGAEDLRKAAILCNRAAEEMEGGRNDNA